MNEYTRKLSARNHHWQTTPNEAHILPQYAMLIVLFSGVKEFMSGPTYMLEGTYAANYACQLCHEENLDHEAFWSV